MSDSTDARVMSESSAKMALPSIQSFDERWAKWREKGARHDARSARHIRLLALMVVLTIGVISALMWLR